MSLWKRQLYNNDATTGWRQDAMQVADICKRLFRLLDDFFEIWFLGRENAKFDDKKIKR